MTNGIEDPDDLESQLDQQFRQTRLQTREATEITTTAEEKAIADAKKQVSKDRSWISRAIIATYGLAILAAVVYIAAKVPECGSGQAEPCKTLISSWETQGELLLELIVTAVLPIVTLMLGFYFGTETSKTSGQENQ